jgi:glucose-6-phosphate isomerase
MDGAPLEVRFAAPAELRAQVEEAVAELESRRFPERLWARDATLWKSDPAHVKIIEDALGWLTVAGDLRAETDALAGFVDEVRADGLKHVVVLGMGGSSLAPEVLHEIFGATEGFLDLRVLDSTDPAAVLAIQDEIELDDTLFVVASKSGGTTETASFHTFFYRRMSESCGEHAGHHFVAITDEGTLLQQEGIEQGFRAIFVNPSDIGGRYSALSFFGMVPAALMGIDVTRLLDDAQAVAAVCGPKVGVADSPALLLGAVIGALARAGRDKLTLLAPRMLAPFGAWLEQLLAESTGKEGRGILPVDLEAVGEPRDYGADRVFACFRFDNEESGSARSPGSTGGTQDDGTGDLDAAVAALEAAGQPVITITLPDRWALGGQFLLWEIATAAAGALLGIDPFDQPNVQESKDNTRALLDVYTETGRLPALEGGAAQGGEKAGAAARPVAEAASAAAIPLAVAVASGVSAVQSAVECLLCAVGPRDYVCLQAYVAPSAAVWAGLDAVRRAVRSRLGAATTAGYGPRFLHSTGQYHKGGPNTGVYLQLLSRDLHDVRIPGQLYPFSVLKHAQADGDLQSLRSRGRRVLRVDLGDDVAAGLAVLVQAVQGAVSRTG